MERFKRIMEKLLFPHPILIFLLTIASAVGLCHVFLNGLDTHPIAYIVYVLSFYALCTIVARIPPIIRRCKTGLYGNAHTARYLTEAELRARISLYMGTVLNLAYGVFNLVIGWYYRSVWFGAIAVYYMVLSLIRFLLVKNDRKSRKMERSSDRYLHHWKSYRVCGWLLLLLNAAMTGMVFQMIWQNQSYSYPGFVIYASAAYTFYRLTMSIIHTIKLRKGEHPLFAAARALDLSIALMSIFALQTAMFNSFGGGMQEDTRQLMNTLTGGTVCFAVVCIAVFMIIRSRKVLKANTEK